MVNIVIAEFRKLKGSNIVWICLAGCFLMPVMSLFVGTSVTRPNAWMEYCTNSMWMSILLWWPCIFGLMGTYIFTRERFENTYKNLFIIPIGRVPLVLSKLFVLLIVILGITFLSYVLNIVGILIGVKFTLSEFVQGLGIYMSSGLLMFIAIFPVLLIALISQKGFLISVCVTFMYAFLSFIGIWSPMLSSVLPIVSILRICNNTSLSIDYSFPVSVNLISMGLIGGISFAGIIYAAGKQEA